MSRVHGGTLVWLTVTWLAACSNSIVFLSRTEPARTPLARSDGKRVAVVAAEPGVAALYETSTDGLTIQVESAQDYVYHMLARSIESGVAKVERASAPRSDVDLNLVPELSVEATGMLSHTCTARFSLSLLDKNGRLLASNQHEAAMDYVAVADGGPACHQAIVTAVETASPPVLRAIDQAP